MKNYRKIIKIGNSQGITFPKKFMKHNKVNIGDDAEIIIKRILRKKEVI